MRRRLPGLAIPASLLLAVVLAAPVAAAVPTDSTVRVGSLDLHACHVLPGALCGSLARAWDPAGVVKGSLQVGFALVPPVDQTSAAVGTLVPHEGGPGYSTSGSAAYYARMYGPLLDHRNLLLVDQRGTGSSVPINCPELQSLTGNYARAAATCAASLGGRVNLAADDRARATVAAAETVADLLDRYLQAAGTSGAGLRGGHWSSNGSRTVQFSFTELRLTNDLSVSGTASWDRYGHVVHCSLRLRQTDPAGQVSKGSLVAGDLVGGWNSNAVGATALLAGQLGGQAVALTFDAP